MIIIALFVFLLIVSALLFRKQIKKMNYIKKIFILIYVVWWLISIIIASTTYGNTFAIEVNTIITFITAIMTFIVGFFVVDIIKNYVQKPKKVNNENVELEYSIKTKKIFINVQIVIQILLLAVLGFYKIRQLQVISIYGEEIKRIAIFEIGYIFNNVMEAGIFNYFISALITVLNIIMIRDILVKKINITIFLQILISIIFFLITYERMLFFNLILYIIFWIIILYGDNIKQLIKQNGKIIIGVLISVCIFLLISSFIRIGISSLNISKLEEAWNKTVDQVFIYFGGRTKSF